MGNRYAADHIAKDHIHTDVACNTEEPQQKYRLGTISNRLLGGAYLLLIYEQDWVVCYPVS